MATVTNPESSQIADFFKSLTKKRIRFIRLLSQIFFFVVINGTFIGFSRIPFPAPIVAPPGAPFTTVWGGFSEIQYLLAQGHFPFLALGVFFLTGALLGRMFCGWVCPVGFWQDILAWIPANPRWIINKADDQFLRNIAKFILFGTIVFAAFIGFSRLSGVLTIDNPFSRIFWDAFDPAGTLFVTWFYMIHWEVIPGTSGFFSNVGGDLNFILVKSLLLVAVSLLSVKIPRFYCRYICPTGALLGYCSKQSILHVRRNPLKCEDGCTSCERACPMNVKITEFGVEGISDMNCISCGACIDECPEAMSFGIRL